MKDFFISYNRADAKWAEWIAWQLDEAGYSTVFQAWDFGAGSNFPLEMNKASSQAEHTIAVLSEDYLRSEYCAPEWAAAFVHDPIGTGRRLIPVRVKECEIRGLLASITYIDLVGKKESMSKEELLSQISSALKLAGGNRAKPLTAPVYPANGGDLAMPPFPSSLPRIWNVPHLRNLSFTGRDQFLKDLRNALASSSPSTSTQAISGLGGIGKTQLAAEYCYRYKSEYDVVWWIRSEKNTTLRDDFAGLALPLDIPESRVSNLELASEAVKKWLYGNRRWLLVFDNVMDPAQVREFIPQTGYGQIIITSRRNDWDGIAATLSLNNFKRNESVQYLQRRTHGDGSADELAKELGDFPLALAQAAGYINNSKTTISEYLRLFKIHKLELLKRQRPESDYPIALETAWSLSLEEVKKRSILADDLLKLMTFFDFDNVPRGMLGYGLAVLKGANDLAFAEAVATLQSNSLIEASADSLSIHRLVHFVTSQQIELEERRKFARVSVEMICIAIGVLNASPKDVLQWPVCNSLFPHAIKVISAAEDMGETSVELRTVMSWCGLYLYNLGRYAEAESFFRRQLDMIDGKLDADVVENADLLTNLSEVIRVQGRYSESESLGRRALKMKEEMLGHDHLDVATSLVNLAELLRVEGKYVEAELLCRRSLQILEQQLGTNHPDVARSMDVLALVLQSLLKYDEAELLHRRALEIREKLFGSDHPEYANSLNNIAVLLNFKGKYLEAELLYRRALGIFENHLGLNHPYVASVLDNLATPLRFQRKYVEAELVFRRALKIRQEQLGPDHIEVATTMSNLGLCLYYQNNYDEAELFFRSALKIKETQLGTQHRDVASVLNNIALVLEARQNYGEAELLFLRALKINEEQLGDDDPSVAEVLNNLGAILFQQRKYAEAEPLCRRAISIYKKIYGPIHPTTMMLQENLDALLEEWRGHTKK